MKKKRTVLVLEADRIAMTQSSIQCISWSLEIGDLEHALQAAKLVVTAINRIQHDRAARKEKEK